ncbi:MAG TPA: glycosyltransferase family 39 protein [Tepidisphaeraceae bacterium]
MAKVPLLPEEAYYWMYSRHLALSYFDHPPMVAWMIRLGTFLLGNTQMGVRIMACLLMCGASVLMFLMARIWFGRDVALLSAAALQILPMYFVIGSVGITDAPLIFFWLVSLWAFSIAVNNSAIWPWCVAGLACGAAMLSRYTAIFIPAGVLLVLLLHKPYRKHFCSMGPYLACLIAVACVTPVILWNAEHHWASFEFQLVSRFDHDTFGWRYIGRFIFYQIIIVTPIFFLALPGMMARVWRLRPHPRWVFIWSFSLPLLVLMTSKCFRYEIHVNWTLPAFVMLIPGAFYLLRMMLRTRRHWKPAICWTRASLICCLVINLSLMIYLLVNANRNSGVGIIAPWPKLARYVEKYEDQLEDQTHQEPMVIAAGTYRLASLVAFYRYPIERDVPSSDYTTSGWFIKGDGLEYEFWSKRDAWRGRNCIFITDDPDLKRRLDPYFASVKVPKSFLTLGGDSFHIAICRNFNPGARHHGR